MYEIEITSLQPLPTPKREKKIHKHFKLRKKKHLLTAVFGNILFLFFILIRDREAKMR